MSDISITSQSIIALKQKTIQAAGVVTVGGAPVARRVICYRNGIENEVHASATSDPVTGAWSMTVYGNSNDVFRFIAIGVESAGESSKIYDFVRE